MAAMNSKRRIDRQQVADRLFALNRILGIGALARRLGTTIPTLDQIMGPKAGRESTYERLLPAIEGLEADLPEFRWHALLDARRRGPHVLARTLRLDREAAERSESWTSVVRGRSR
jgi:hypothetical protein